MGDRGFCSSAPAFRGRHSHWLNKGAQAAIWRSQLSLGRRFGRFGLFGQFGLFGLRLFLFDRWFG